MNRYTKVRELVKDPSLTIKDIAQQTGYDKGHVSRLRKASQQFECPRCGHCCQPQNNTPLRDYFAGKAMQGFIDYAAAKGHFVPPDDQLAQCSYDVADAMLKARER
jgi:hypothetical protein